MAMAWYMEGIWTKAYEDNDTAGKADCEQLACRGGKNSERKPVLNN